MKMLAHGEETQKQEEYHIVHIIRDDMKVLQHGMGLIHQDVFKKPAQRGRRQKIGLHPGLYLGGDMAGLVKALGNHKRGNKKQNQHGLPGMVMRVGLGVLIPLRPENPPPNGRDNDSKKNSSGGIIL